MTFTNVTSAGIYMQCCHREVAPGESFTVSWLEAKDNRAVRMAMRAGALAWESGPDEPLIEGSVKLPSVKERESIKAERAAKEKARKAEEAKRLDEQMRRDDETVKANMANMGHFSVPRVTPVRKRVDTGPREKPITREDVIADDKPKSLADIMRHNRAVKKFADADTDADSTQAAGESIEETRKV